MTISSEKQHVLELVKSIETGDSAPIRYINSSKYIQHNLGAKDGVQGFADLVHHRPPDSRVSTARVFQDGEYVLAHTEYNFFGPKIGFDLFRFENGKIVEHWDNVQEKPAAPNPSGHSMIDGPTEASDLGQTRENKRLVRQFIQDILVDGKMDERGGYYNGDRYTQHNPQIADGLSGLGQALQALAAQGVAVKYDRIHRVLGEGNFVLVVSEGSLAGKPTSFYDLFRVESGKIAEHWDTVESIPPQNTWQNQNGKF